MKQSLFFICLLPSLLSFGQVMPSKWSIDISIGHFADKYYGTSKFPPFPLYSNYSLGVYHVFSMKKHIWFEAGMRLNYYVWQQSALSGSGAITRTKFVPMLICAKGFYELFQKNNNCIILGLKSESFFEFAITPEIAFMKRFEKTSSLKIGVEYSKKISPSIPISQTMGINIEWLFAARK